MRFDRPMLQAIVKEGKLSDPEAEAYLVDTLIARQQKIGKVYLNVLTPLDAFSIEGGRLCMIDLSVYYGFNKVGVVERLDNDEGVINEHTVDNHGRTCVALPETDSYAVYRLRSRHSKNTRPAMQIHLKGGIHARILGVIRSEDEIVR